MLEQAIALIAQGRYTCLVLREGTVALAMRGVGVKPLVFAYNGGRSLLQGAQVADKVIGKAAAVIAVLGGAGQVYGQVMSQSAVDYLTRHQIPFSYGQLVPAIRNRADTGLCPLEESVVGIEDPAEGFAAIQQRIAQLMAGTSAG